MDDTELIAIAAEQAEKALLSDIESESYVADVKSACERLRAVVDLFRLRLDGHKEH